MGSSKVWTMAAFVVAVSFLLSFVHTETILTADTTELTTAEPPTNDTEIKPSPAANLSDQDVVTTPLPEGETETPGPWTPNGESLSPESQIEDELEEGREVMEEFYQRYNTTNEVDLVFVLDRSGSVPRKGWQSIVDFVKNVLEHFTVDRHNTRVAVVTFSTTASVDINDLEPNSSTDMETKCTLYRRLDERVGRRTPYGYTATHDALQNVAQVLLDSRPTSKKAVIVVTDGKSNIGPPPVRMSVDIHGLRWSPGTWDSTRYGPQVEIYAFGVADANVAELSSIASKLSGHIFTMSTFTMFEEFARSIHGDKQEKSWLMSDRSDCTEPCFGPHSNCMCGTKAGHYACVCDPGYELYNGECIACRKGYFKERMTPEPCRPCSENTSTSHEASTRMEDCKLLPGFVRCPPLPSIDHADLFYVEGDVADEVQNTGIPCVGVTDGNSCHYVCETGFRLTGPPALTCNYSGAWVGSIPSCRVVDCHPIDGQYRSIVGITVDYLNSSTTYMTSAKVSCRRGTIPVGNTIWNCNSNGLWMTPADFRCQDIYCDKIPTDGIVQAVHEECRLDRVPIETECQMHCALPGYQLIGVNDFICRYDGTPASWKPDLWPECKDIQAPTIVCPKDLDVTVADWGQNTTIVHYDVQKPVVTDNSGKANYRVKGLPNDQLVFPVGFVALTYEAYDETGNTATCVQYVHVRARTVVVDRCPDNISITVTSLRRTSYVEWQSPVFTGAGGAELPHVCSVASGSEFFLGSQHVVCYAKDYPGVTCQFQVNVLDPPCPIPFPERPPANGALICGATSHYYPRVCRIHCREGYELRRYEASHKFVCQWDGTWKVDGAGWPDCQLSRRSPKALMDNQLYIRFTGVCSEVKTTIADAFLVTMTKLLRDEHGPCPEDQHCAVENIQVLCSGAPSRTRMRRRRRDVDADSLANDEAVIEFVVSAAMPDTRQSPVTVDDQSQLDATLDDVVDALAAAAASHEALTAETVMTEVHEVSRRWETISCGVGEVREERDGGAPVCYMCPPGTYKKGNECLECPLGTYQNADGQMSCLPCPVGTETVGRGTRDITDCRGRCKPGHFSPGGLEPCSTCDPGTFQNSHGATECITCPEMAVNTLPDHAATDITDCFAYVACEDYQGTCDTTSGFRCIRRATISFVQPDVYEFSSVVECACSQGAGKCVRSSQNGISPVALPAVEESTQQTTWFLTPLNDNRPLGDDFDLAFVSQSSGESHYVDWVLPSTMTSWSACAWVRLSTRRVGGDLLSLVNAGGHGRSIRVSTSYNQLTVGSEAVTIPIGQAAWNHLCVMWTQLTGYAQFYVNGTALRDVYWTAISDFVHQGATLRLGQQFSGLISQFAVFDHVLTESEVNVLSRRSSGKCHAAVGNRLSWNDVRARVTLSTQPLDNVFLASGSRCLDASNRNCLDGQTTSTCRCPAEFDGDLCDRPVVDTPTEEPRHCSPNPCLNGGTCTVGVGGTAVCRCPHKWTGKRCQVSHGHPSCSLNPCVNNGTCVDDLSATQLASGSTSSYRCVCPQLTTPSGLPVLLGANCERLSSCDTLPCGEHGTCVALDTGEHRCVCEQGYVEPDCTRRRTQSGYDSPGKVPNGFDYCASVDCLNGGTCVNTHTGFTCMCPRDFTGRYCTTPRSSDVKRFRAVLTLLISRTADTHYNSAFHDSLRLQIHRMFANLTGDNKLYVVINDVSGWSDTITVDVSLIFTRYLDAILFNNDDVIRVLLTHLKTGRIGQYPATADNFVCEEIHVPATSQSAGIDRDILLLVIIFILCGSLLVALVVRMLRRHGHRLAGFGRYWAASADSGPTNKLTDVDVRTNVLNSQNAAKDTNKVLQADDSDGSQSTWPTKHGQNVNVNWETEYRLKSAKNLWELEHQLKNDVVCPDDKTQSGDDNLK